MCSRREQLPRVIGVGPQWATTDVRHKCRSVGLSVSLTSRCVSRPSERADRHGFCGRERPLQADVASPILRGKQGSLYSITERRVPELIPVLGSQPAGDVSDKPGGRLPLLSARPAVTPATLKRAATNLAACWV